MQFCIIVKTIKNFQILRLLKILLQNSIFYNYNDTGL